MSFSVIVPSKNLANLTACAKAVREAGETGRVIVVWDGEESALEVRAASCFRIGDQVDHGIKPFCFARNVNIGIASAGTDDVILLNDDALLQSAHGFGCMSELIPDEYGILTASTNVTGYPGQWRRTGEQAAAVRELTVAAFVCVYIPRRTLQLVGLLDERFGGPGVYAGEDVDYCRRVRAAGLKVGVTDFCFVDHSTLPSTFRAAHPGNAAPGDIRESNRLLAEKWGPNYK